MLFQRFVEYGRMVHLVDQLSAMGTFRIIEKEDHVRGGEGIEVARRAICRHIVEVCSGCPFPILEAQFQQDRWTDLLLLAPTVALGVVFQDRNLHLVVLHG